MIVGTKIAKKTQMEKEIKVRELKDFEKELILMLWDYLKKDPENKDRRKTGIGTKTKVGLVNSIMWIIDKHKRP